MKVQLVIMDGQTGSNAFKTSMISITKYNQEERVKEKVYNLVRISLQLCNFPCINHSFQPLKIKKKIRCYLLFLKGPYAAHLLMLLLCYLLQPIHFKMKE